MTGSVREAPGPPTGRSIRSGVGSIAAEAEQSHGDDSVLKNQEESRGWSLKRLIRAVERIHESSGLQSESISVPRRAEGHAPVVLCTVWTH